MCHVLIIEDEWLTAEWLATIVEEVGASSIDIAAGQDAAIEAARLRKPAIILSDVTLMQGAGPDAVRAIQGEYGTIPVIFITASPKACEFWAPPAIVLAKPVNPREITAAFKRITSH